MERDGDGERERPSFGVAKLYEIHAIYGWRLRAASLPRLCATLSHSCALGHSVLVRAVDPTKMTEREKRNAVSVPDLYLHSEFLVYGGFREDEEYCMVLHVLALSRVLSDVSDTPDIPDTFDISDVVSDKSDTVFGFHGTRG